MWLEGQGLRIQFRIVLNGKFPSKEIDSGTHVERTTIWYCRKIDYIIYFFVLFSFLLNWTVSMEFHFLFEYLVVFSIVCEFSSSSEDLDKQKRTTLRMEKKWEFKWKKKRNFIEGNLRTLFTLFSLCKSENPLSMFPKKKNKNGGSHDWSWRENRKVNNGDNMGSQIFF